MILSEPQALLTEASKMPGLDGQKMSKSYNNTITLREDADSVTRKIRTMPTDPARVRRTDPGDPEKCPVWQFHLVYSDDKTKEWVQQGCTQRGHRLPRVQAAGDRRGAERAGADARARPGLSGRSDLVTQHHRGRLRPGAQAGGRDHARRARGDGVGVRLSWERATCCASVIRRNHAARASLVAALPRALRLEGATSYCASAAASRAASPGPFPLLACHAASCLWRGRSRA